MISSDRSLTLEQQVVVLVHGDADQLIVIVARHGSFVASSSRHQSTDCDQEGDVEVLLLTLWLILIEQHSSPRVICVSRNRTFDANHFNERRISAGKEMFVR